MNTLTDDGGARPAVTSARSRRIGKALIGIAMAILFLLIVGGSLIVWLIYSSRTPSPEITVASFRADFQEAQPRSGWRYLWNPAGEIGKTNHYVDLNWNGVAYGANDSPERPQPGPAHYVRISKSGGHPGHGKPQRGDIDTYVIFAFTVTNRGFYVITNSYIIRSDAKLNGDVNLRVYVNESVVDPEIICGSKTPVRFDRSLGNLEAGDSLYVAVGPNGMDRNDAFQLDFGVAFRKAERSQ
jgi:hypothetical protein